MWTGARFTVGINQCIPIICGETRLIYTNWRSGPQIFILANKKIIVPSFVGNTWWFNIDTSEFVSENECVNKVYEPLEMEIPTPLPVSSVIWLTDASSEKPAET